MKSETPATPKVFLALAAGALWFGGGPPASAAQTRLPNIVIVFTDDQGYADVGVFGAPTASTSTSGCPTRTTCGRSIPTW